MNRHERRRAAKVKRGGASMTTTRTISETELAESRLDFEALVAAGYLVPTGKMRRDRQGVLQPVYVLRKYAAAMGLPLPPLLPVLPVPEDDLQ
jgi:hypothetical protein